METIGISVKHEQPGFYWQLDDPAGLRFNHADGAPPTHLECYTTSDPLNHAETIRVPLADIRFLGAGFFGEGRPSGFCDTKWTGASHRYAVYEWARPYRNPGIVLVENHGGGMVCYAFHSLVSFDLWKTAVSVLTSEQLWDLCREFADIYNTARAIEERRMTQAFLEGRFKKVRRNGHLHLRIQPRGGGQ